MSPLHMNTEQAKSLGTGELPFPELKYHIRVPYSHQSSALWCRRKARHWAASYTSCLKTSHQHSWPFHFAAGGLTATGWVRLLQATIICQELLPLNAQGGHEGCPQRHFFMVHAFKTSWHSGLAEQLLCTCYEHGKFPGAPNVIPIIGNAKHALKCLLLLPVFLTQLLHTHCSKTVSFM